MKKLASIILCIALLTGVCAAAVAEEKTFSLYSEETKYDKAIKDIGTHLAVAAEDSSEIYKSFDKLGYFDKFKFLNSFKDAHAKLIAEYDKITEILEKLDKGGIIDKSDYEKSLAIAEAAYALANLYSNIKFEKIDIDSLPPAFKPLIILFNFVADYAQGEILKVAQNLIYLEKYVQ